MFKRAGTIFLGLLVLFSIFAVLVPRRASAASTPEQDIKRRQLTYLRECLKDHISDGDSAENFNDFWDGDGEDYTKALVVVGLDVDSVPGVQSCKTILRAAVPIFDPAQANAEAFFVRKMSGRTNLGNSQEYDPTIGEGTIKSNRDAWVREIDQKIDALGDPKKAFTANRLGPLIKYCYDIRAFSPSSDVSGHDFTTTLRGTKYWFDFKEPDDDSISIIDQNGEGGKAHIGDIELGFVSSSVGRFVGRWDPYESDWFPFGDDLPNFTSGHTNDQGILDCKFINENKDFFSDNSVVMSVDTDTDAVIFGLDTNGDGTADQGLTPVATPETGLDESGDAHVDCETGGLSSVGALVDRAISWLVCPIVDGAQGIVNSVGQWVVSQLEFDVDAYLENPVRDKKTGAETVLPVKNAWNAFRVISLSLLILIALAGLLLGGFMDAYTIKKILPRLLIAVIAISLSWDLLELAINVTNASGAAIRGIINTPFNALGNASINPAIILGGAGVATGLTTILGALSLIGTAALAVMFAFVFTVLRVAAIIAFVIFAPLAILLWILPGTQKGWNFWREGLTGALLMFPIVSAFLAIGAAFGKIIFYAHPDKALNQSMALIATYAPYFLIPKAFTMAGGIVGNLSGQINDRGRGAFDRLKKFRQDQGQKRRSDIKSGNFFRGGNDEKSLRGRFNKRTMQASNINALGFNPKRWDENMRRVIGDHEMHESEEIMKSGEGRLLTDDDISYSIYHSNGSEEDIRRHLMERAPSRFAGDENKDALDGAVAGALALQKKHGIGGVRLAALRTNFNSSTGWANDYEYEKDEHGDFVYEEDGVTKKKAVWTQQEFENGATDVLGNRITQAQVGTAKVASYTASGKMLEDINKISGGNRMLSTQLLAEARAGQSRAGREDTGGGGFSDTAAEMDKLHRGDTITYVDDAGVTQTRQYNVQDATLKVTESLIKGKPIHQIFASGKQAIAEAVAPVLKQRTENFIATAATAAEAQISQIQSVEQIEREVENQVSIITADTTLDRQQKLARIQQVSAVGEQRINETTTAIEQVRKTQQDEVVRAIALEQMTHAAAASSSPEIARVLGDQVYSQPFPMDAVPDQMRELIVRKLGKDNPTRSEVYDALRDDTTWQSYTKEYGRALGGRPINDAEVAAHAAQMGISAEQARAQLEAEAQRQAAEQARQAGGH